jgi:hypothetical protein
MKNEELRKPKRSTNKLPAFQGFVLAGFTPQKIDFSGTEQWRFLNKDY